MTIEERLQRLQDLEEIRQLFTAYAQHLDHANCEAHAELFAIAGHLDLGPAGQATGRAAIRALIEKIVQRRTVPVRHILSSPVIRLDGDRVQQRAKASKVSNQREKLHIRHRPGRLS